MIPNKSKPSCESTSTPQTSEDELPNPIPSSESILAPKTSEALDDKLPNSSESFPAFETLTTPEDLQVENTRNSGKQVFGKPLLLIVRCRDRRG